jgi:hypothetical protein
MASQTTKRQEQQAEEDFSELLLDYARWSADRSSAYLGRIEGKTATLAGLIGVMLTILLTMAPSCFPKLEFGNGLVCFAQWLFLLAAIALIGALVFCLASLMTANTKEYPTESLIDNHLATPVGQVTIHEKRHNLANTLASVDKSHFKAGNDKSAWVKWVYRCLFIFVAAVALASFSVIGHMIDKNRHESVPNQHQTAQ